MSETSQTTLRMPDCDHRPLAYEGPSKEDVLAMRREFLTPALLTFYRDPVMIVEGHMQWLFDEKGHRYLDAFAGIVSVSVGHCHPKVIDAVREQNDRLQHTTTIYLHPTIARFGKKLASTFPEGSGLGVCYFTNSGSESNDLAILMARAYTGNYDVVALRNGYHGGSPHAMGLTGQSTWKYSVPSGFGVHHAAVPDRYQGHFGYDDPQAGVKYAADVKDLIQRGTSGQVAAFIAEPIQGVGGAVVLPPGYLEEVYRTVREAGGLCIADEVQTGFGRTGVGFWGFESHGVVPDIVTMAKGIGNGAPLGACVTRADVAATLTSRIHFNTFGGNPVSCAQGLATLDILLEEGFQDRARTLGDRLRTGLEELAGRHSAIGDVRGQGLMVGVEIVGDRKSKEPDSARTVEIFERAKEHGVLIGKGGYWGNVLRIKPPMCLSEQDIDFLLEVLDRAFTETDSA